MTQSAVDTNISPERLSILIATAAVLQLSESMLPYPIPGLRLGLANIISLIVLFQFGYKSALVVTLLRTVVSSFIIGSFLSPGFVLSFTAGLASISVAAFCLRISAHIPFLQLSPLGVGIIGAFVHNMIQLLLAYVMFFNHPGIFVLVPWLTLGSVILGGLSGSLATAVLNRLSKEGGQLSNIPFSAPSLENRTHQPGKSIIHRCPVVVKIGFVLIATLLTVFYENLFFYICFLFVIAALIFLSTLSYRQVFSVLKKLWSIILGAFLLPLYFNHGSQELISTPFGTLHLEAFLSSVIFSMRIILLALLSNLLARTTSVESFTNGIRIYLKPFDLIGVNSSNVAENISNSLSALPRVWIEMRSLLSFFLAGKPRNLKTIRDAAIHLFMHLFTSTKHISSNN
ncbi:MAG: heptaprenyl diphosphate synthase [Desulforhopalus sp.]|jgi:heptaprenyl diphosphate synthase